MALDGDGGRREGNEICNSGEMSNYSKPQTGWYGI